MRVDLVVQDESFSERAQNAWRAFRQAVAPLTFECLDEEAHIEISMHLGMPPGAAANAEWVPAGRIMPEYARFCLSNGFFQRDLDGQTVILLHEAVHIRRYRGRLRENYLLIRQQPRFPNVTTQFELDRLNLSEEMLTFVQEVGVDKVIVAAACPRAITDRYFTERARYYTNGEGHQYDDNRSPSLAIYRLYYRLLRAELGLIVIRDQELRAQIEALRQRYDAGLQQRAGAQLQWFRDMQRKFLAVTIDTDAPDPEPYRELFDRVRDVPAPNQT